MMMMTRAISASGVALVSLLLASSCQRKSEIVLVIDTDLTVPAEIDRVEVSVAGADRGVPPIVVDLTAAGAPRFPLTLGLVAASGSSSVVVSVAGKSAGVPVVAQDARTAFVDGEQRMLRMLLLLSCGPVSCQGDQTCGPDGCGPVDRPAASLPAWTGKPPPRPVRNTPPVGRTVWASGWHSAATEGGALYGWGQNADGQLGNGTTQNANSRRRVLNVQNPTAVGLGQLHSCICDQSKQAWCWGRNAEGQLGAGNLTPSSIPIPVPGLNDCEQIVGGAHHACVLRSDKTVWCWGQNTNGQVGQPAGAAPVTTPHLVPELADVAEVQCGEFYTCARKIDGVIMCWGRNDVGELGDGTTTQRSTPAPVVNLTTDIEELVAGRFFACVRHTSGHVSCWGANGAGQLGVATPPNSTVPLANQTITDAAQLTAGQQHACFIHRGTGMVSCWGGNSSGQLGDGTTISAVTPVDVLQITNVSSIAAGSQYTCARDSKRVSCWGDNLVNQLGDGSTTNRSAPVTVAGF